MVDGAFFIYGYIRKENMTRQSITIYLQSPWTIRNGKAISPITIMVEGVHNGSHGPIFWAAHILKQNAGKWEGVPVVINHPMVNGKHVSITETPEQIIGHVRRPYFDEVKKAIRAEIELPANTPRLSEIQNIKEISAGVFSDEVYTAGVWNSEEYKACSITMEPDHCALLPGPGARGACSFSDGCGLRANSSGFQLYDDITNAIMDYFKGDFQMNQDERLLPADMISVNTEFKDEQDLRTLQEAADRQGLLLPTEYNGTGKAANADPGADDEILMPCGFERRA